MLPPAYCLPKFTAPQKIMIIPPLYIHHWRSDAQNTLLGWTTGSEKSVLPVVHIWNANFNVNTNILSAFNIGPIEKRQKTTISSIRKVFPHFP